MRRPILIKRRREIIVEVSPVPFKKTGENESLRKEVTSIVMMSKRIDEFEDGVRKKMESEMIVYSCKVHSQAFLWSLIPSVNKDRKC
jgi:hypothetical protein